MPQFKSWKSYSRFSGEILRRRRYVRTPEAEEFLRAVASTCKARLRPVPQGTRLWRAQLGNDWWTPDEPPRFEQAVPFPPRRMKPLLESAPEGRANPKGIPCLYLSTTANAAMSEQRPWIDSLVSVAQFETVRPLIVVDCSVLHDQYLKLAFLERAIGEEVSPDKIDDIVWAAIDHHFAEPVTRTDDTADYAATQTIAELFRDLGHDGVAYKSAFGEHAYSIALFDLDSAAQLDGQLYETKSVEFKFEQSGNPYFVSRV